MPGRWVSYGVKRLALTHLVHPRDLVSRIADAPPIAERAKAASRHANVHVGTEEMIGEVALPRSGQLDVVAVDHTRAGPRPDNRLGKKIVVPGIGSLLAGNRRQSEQRRENDKKCFHGYPPTKWPASISTRKSGWASPATCSIEIVGGFGNAPPGHEYQYNRCRNRRASRPLRPRIVGADIP